MLAIAQMGVHLVFFLHITTGADNTNNVLALAFGLLIVFLVIGGSLWIMSHLNEEHAGNGPADADAAVAGTKGRGRAGAAAKNTLPGGGGSIANAMSDRVGVMPQHEQCRGW